jgi:4,5-DOPA dioxygenase extradiol
MSSEKLMPVVFIGHGSPMNAIADNAFTQSLHKLGQDLPRPKAIVIISAHWLTHDRFIATTANPETIHDFGGFPPELYELTYFAPGSPELAKKIYTQIPELEYDHHYGLDHGAWTVLKHIYPNHDIPCLQISIDYGAGPQAQFDFGKKLKFLREQEVLVLGSGNIVHNLPISIPDLFSGETKAKDFAVRFDETVKEKLLQKDFQALIDYKSLGADAMQSIPTPDHYYPLLTILGLIEKNDEIKFTYEEVLSAMSMRCFTAS